MKFNKPQKKQYYQKIILKSAITLSHVLCQSYGSAIEHLPDLRDEFEGKLENNPENVAWTFLSICVSTALIILLREPRMRCDMTHKELTDHAKGLIDALPDDGDIRRSDLINLALAKHMQKCIQQASELIIKATPESDFNQSQLKQMYREALTRSVTVVFQRQSNLFSGMIESITGPTEEPEMREFAWQRHGAWCRGLYCESSIFSPDNDIDIPLSHVYQKLRCYWNTQHKQECDRNGEPLKYRTATVADLHKTIDTWLDEFDECDAIRLIAGGPGSGKSSFAKAFATELYNKQSHRVLFIQLQEFDTDGGNLRESIGRHLKNNYHLKTPHKCEGFPGNSLEWHGEDTRPLLMIFDGLDEMIINTDNQNDLTRKFVVKLKRLLSILNKSNPAAAVVLGRNVTMNVALDDGGLKLDNLIHVAPIRKMTLDDLQLDKNPSNNKINKGFNPVNDPSKLIENDTRKAYWNKWCQVKGMSQSEPPQAILDDQISDLNAEPLLLHLLLISDYCNGKWKDAADNRNLVYENIFSKIFNRNKDKDLYAYRKLNETHFFELMEVFGLAAFRGNGRTGDSKEFHYLCEMYVANKDDKRIYSKLDGADLKNVALMIHSRPENKGIGFEFVHKSFGEYFAARALLGAADRLQRLWHDGNKDEMHLAKRWVNFVGTGQISNSILRFLHDQCRQWKLDRIEKTIGVLNAIFDKTLKDGFPVHKSDIVSRSTYRNMEYCQQCAEKTMLVTLTSLWKAHNENSENNETPVITLDQFKNSNVAVLDMIIRLFPAGPRAIGIAPMLNGLSLKGSYLQEFCLRFAKLEGSDLSEAILIKADLSHTNLKKANFINAELSGAEMCNSNLSGANLRGAILFRTNLNGANLCGAKLSRASLPEVNLNRANLNKVDLRMANLTSSNLSGTYLNETNLKNADLWLANLSEANLCKVNLRGANLRAANLEGANLESIDLTECYTEEMSVRSVDFRKDVKLTQKQVDTFFGVKFGPGKTILPEHLSYPNHWHAAKFGEEGEPPTTIEEYSNDYYIWINSRCKPDQNTNPFQNKPKISFRLSIKHTCKFKYWE